MCVCVCVCVCVSVYVHVCMCTHAYACEHTQCSCGVCSVGRLLSLQDGGSLDKILKSGGRIPVEMIQLISLSVCSGLRYLKENHGIIHRGGHYGSGKCCWDPPV